MRSFFVAFLVLCFPACTTAPVPMDAGAPVGAPCRADGDCASGACLVADAVCTASCTTDAECGATLVCGRAACAEPGGCAQCVPPCGSGDYTCVEGVSTSCSLVEGSTHCLDCGCPVAEDHCVRDVGCFPPAPVGDPCVLDRDCASGSCSTFAGVCRVAVGTACTPEDCDLCLTLPSGATQCSRECRTSVDCRGATCSGTLVLECRLPACAGGDCTVERAPREAGQACRLDTDCASGHCFSSQRCSGEECVSDGWCSAPCTGAGDCGEGARCVVIPCADGQTEGCGNLCLHACAEFVDCGIYGGSCSQLETPERTLASVCDVRREDGRNCVDDRECLSTHCVSGFCAP